MSRDVYTVRGLNLVRRLLSLVKDGCRLYKVKRHGDAVSFEADSESYTRVKASFEGVDVRNRRFSLRLSLLIPIVVCAIALFVSSLFVYDVEVVGYDVEKVSAVIGRDRYVGVFKGAIDTDEIENVLYHSLDLSVVDVKIVGARLLVTCREELPQSEILDVSTTTALRGNSDGVVSRVVLLRGTALVREGMAVRCGDVLIDTYETLGDSRVESEAIGAVYAKVYHTTRIVLTKDIFAPTRTGRVEVFESVDIAGMSNPPPSSYEYYDVEKTLVPIGEILPIYLVKYTYYETTLVSVANPNYDDYYHLLTLAYQQLEEECSDEMILSKWHVVTDVEDYRYVDVYIESEREICSNLG